MPELCVGSLEQTTRNYSAGGVAAGSAGSFTVDPLRLGVVPPHAYVYHLRYQCA